MKPFLIKVSLLACAVVLFSVRTEGDITEFSFSEESWRPSYDTDGSFNQQHNQYIKESLSTDGPELLERLKNAEYLYPLPTVNDSKESATIFSGTDVLPLRSKLGTLSSKTLATQKLVTNRNLAHVTEDGAIRIQLSKQTVSSTYPKIVVLTYLDKTKNNTASILVAGHEEINLSSTNMIGSYTRHVQPVGISLRVNAATLFTTESKLFSLASLIFVVLLLCTKFYFGNNHRKAARSSPKVFAQQMPLFCAFVENKDLLTLTQNKKNSSQYTTF